MTAAPYPEPLMVWRGERAWKAVAREKAIAELQVQLEQARLVSPGHTGRAAEWVDAVLGTAMPYLEAGWRDAAVRYAWWAMGFKDTPTPHPPWGERHSWPPLPETAIYRFLWRAIPAEEMPLTQETIRGSL